MESINNFEKAKEIIKNNLISRVESIKDVTSEDKYFEYLKDKDVSDSEFKVVRNKKDKNKRKSKKKFNFFIKSFLSTSLFYYFLAIILDNHARNSISSSLTCLVFILVFNSFFCYIATYLMSRDEIEYMKKNASPNELKELYKKEFKENIDDYLSLSKEEIKGLCDSNEFISAYVKNNPNEIFTRYSLNKVAGIKMNNLHMINEFKNIIDNKKILDGLPDGQKIFVNDIIMTEQKLN